MRESPNGGQGACGPSLLGPLVLLRHGTSCANRAGRSAGWEDTDLAPEGVSESYRAAESLVSTGVGIGAVHSSTLTRARRTAEIVATSLGLRSSDISESWRLNERHAGALEGLTRGEMVERFGRMPVRSWKRSLHVRPPQMDGSDSRHPKRDPRYREVPAGLLPSGEAGLDVLRRLLPYWQSAIVQDLSAQKGVLIVTHDYVIRLLMWQLQGRPVDGPTGDQIPNGVPIRLWWNPESGRCAHSESTIEASDHQ